MSELQCEQCGGELAEYGTGVLQCKQCRSLHLSPLGMRAFHLMKIGDGPRVDDDATVKAEPFSLIAEDGLGPNTIATPSSWAHHTITSGRLWDGDLLATYRRAHAQVVAAIAAGLRDAGLTDEATIDRLTEAVVKRLGEG